MDKHLEKLLRRCLICNKQFFPRKETQKFCSQQCYWVYRKKFLTREKSSRWKGGKYISDGYVRISVGNRRYRYEHRLVMEKHLGRPLKRMETVHHINGNRLDNRIENLEIFASPGQHILKAHPRAMEELLQARRNLIK